MLSTRHAAGYVPGAELENSRCRRCARAPRGPSAPYAAPGRAAAERPCTLPSYPAHAPRLPTRPRTGRRSSGGLAVDAARRMSRPTVHLRRPGGSYAWRGQARGRVHILCAACASTSWARVLALSVSGGGASASGGRIGGHGETLLAARKSFHNPSSPPPVSQCLADQRSRDQRALGA